MPRTVLRWATKRPVRYSAKWRGWASLAKKSPYWATASRTTVGNSTIPGMIRCSALQQRPRESGSECTDSTYFDAVEKLFAKPQFKPQRLYPSTRLHHAQSSAVHHGWPR